MTHRSIAIVAVLSLALGLFACGSRRRGVMRVPDSGAADAMTPPPDSGPPPEDGGLDAGRPDAGSGDAGVDAGPDPATDRQFFVPAIPYTYGGSIADPGVEVFAFTVRRDPTLGNLDFLAAIRNVSTLTLCSLDLRTRFFDASGLQIGSATGLVETPPHRGSSGAGSLVDHCLGPGQIGMQSALLDLGSADESEIASATWSVYALNLTDAVPTTDVRVEGVTTTTSSGRSRFTGRVVNGTTGTVSYPSVSIFGVNAVGRPLFESSAISSTTLSPGASWTFETNPSFMETFADYSAFASVVD